MRIVALLFVGLLLTSCTVVLVPVPVEIAGGLSLPTAVSVPTPRPAPTSTAAPDGLPTTEHDMASWMLTTKELDYIQYINYTLQMYIDSNNSRTKEFQAALDAYRADTTLLTNNAWRARMAKAGRGLEELSYFFGDAPSERFAPLAAQVDKMAALLQEANGYVVAAIDKNDGKALDDAEKLLADLNVQAETLQAEFAELMN